MLLGLGPGGGCRVAFNLGALWGVPRSFSVVIPGFPAPVWILLATSFTLLSKLFTVVLLLLVRGPSTGDVLL